MPYNKGVYAFEDVREIFDKALERENGLKITCESHGKAVTLRARFNYFRQLNRIDNAKIYEPDHKMHANSVYDQLQLRIPKKGTPGDNVLFIEKRLAINFNVEDL